MKSGAGDDPFEDIFDTEADENTLDPEAQSSAGDSTEMPDEGDGHSAVKNDSGREQSGGESSGIDEQSAADSADDPEIPWIFRRDKVKSDRDKVHQLFVRPETDRAYRRFESDLEEAMDTDLSRLDVREAAYLVGMQHPELVVSVLESWGYNYFD
ncbi:MULTISPECIES: hypothetical protein [unclassified Haladaptatus]|uniref:hypothetical protein n=1 Tax=unclassified Haladaptatus TaxID=2622732 RepID=UPI0023E8229B|nr:MULTISPECIES: hypothetical protein [unclassified Haladaptatus]